MTETTIRVVAVVAAAIIVAGIALAQRRASAIRRRGRRFPDTEPGLVLFSSQGCATCAMARSALEAAERPFRQVVYETDPDEFTRLGIDRVPAVGHVDPNGDGWIAHGVVSRRRLVRWLRDP